MAGFTGLKDMFDGGGAGKSGDRFEGGGALSDLANRVARPVGYAQRERSAGREPTSYVRDMFDGGGLGASGETFQGAGLYSGILNALGVRPAGYEARGQQMLQSALANTLQAMPQPQPSSAPMTSARPPRRFMGPDMPSYLPTLVQGVQSEMMPAGRALYGQNVPFGGYALPQPVIQSVPAPVPAPVMTPPAPTGPVVGTSPAQHTSLWNKLFPNGLY